MYTQEITVNNEVGLHARPATFFIQKANEFKSGIWVEKDDRRVNAKSLLGVLSLGIVKGTTITLIADGADEKEAVGALVDLVKAGSVIAQVFNTLGAIPGNIIVFLIISLAGNALNFALNLLGCYVHDLRLQCLEYFGKFYEDGGKPFKPLMADTKYVDIAK